MDKITLIEKDYCSEELCDLDRDVSECLDPLFTPGAKHIPVDEHGFHPGVFKVSITWVNDNG